MMDQRPTLIMLVLCLGNMGAMAVEKPSTVVKTCVTAECHADYQAKKHVHGPVALGACKSCHRDADPAAHTYNLVRQGQELCAYCHLDQTLDKNVHQPLQEGKCTGCHDPHATDYPFLIAQPTVAELCVSCHDQTLNNMKVLHGPVAAGQCTLCHSSHSSPHDNLLTFPPDELCFYCHETTGHELQELAFVHEPVKNGCTECHNPHGTNYPMVLNKPVPQLCYSCHADIEETAEKARFKHDVVTREGGCAECHTPHASSVPAGLKSDPLSLCMSCHDQEVETDGGKILANFKEEVAGKKYLHGPVAQKDCKACHISHGSDHFRLLTKEYPAGFYAPFDVKIYDLCFGCHASTLVLEEETDDFTDFRNGVSNLHYLHVNKPDKGRTCRACHATHASDWPKHIREKTPYGNWEIPIQFKKTETGGSCQPGCHKPRGYDRENPVNYDLPKKRSLPNKPADEPNDPGDPNHVE